MVLFPNSKINIGLNILSKRPDGYHEIESLFYPIGWKDILEFVENNQNKLNFSSSGLSIPGSPDDNLVCKAYLLLARDFSLPGLDIHLHKVIPFGAGLGGGSSDAAFFLEALNEHFGLGISFDHLMKYAARLGADCSFFLANKPAYVTGIGEKLDPIAVNLQNHWLLLIKPPFSIDTKMAYSGVKPHPFAFDFKKIITGDVADWQKYLTNDFESSLFEKFQDLSRIKIKLIEKGATYASMSGSGSSVYGIFPSKINYLPDDFPEGCIIYTELL